MGNPFDFFSGSSGGGGGGTPIDAQTAANGPSVMNRIFNPDKGGILGTIGDITGQHSNAERMGAVDANILQKLSGFYQSNGGDQQRAILSLLNDPVGHDLMSRPGASDTLDRWVKSVQPAITPIAPGSAPMVTKNGNASMGSPNKPTESQNFDNGVPIQSNTPAETKTTLTSRNGSQTIEGPPRVTNTPPGSQTSAIGNSGQPVPGSGVSTPTVPAQNFAYFSKFFNGTSEEEMSNLAKLQVAGSDVQQKSLAVRSLVQRGAITAETGDKILADQLVVMQGINGDGELNHMFHLIDRTTGTNMQLTPNPTQAPGDQSLVVPPAASGGKPTVFPAAGKQADGSYDVQSVIAADPLDNMFLGSGIGNHVISLAGQIVRSTVDPRNPEVSNQLSSFRHDRIDQFQTAIGMLGAMHNGRLKQMTELWLKDTPGKFTDPKDAYNQAIGLRQRLETMQEQNNGYLDPKRGGGPARYSTSILKDKDEENMAIKNVLSAMPTIPAMQQMIQKIQVLPGTAMSLPGVGKAVGGIVGGMVTDAVGGNSSGDGASVRASRIRERNAAQSQPGATNAKAPTVEDIGKMDMPTLQTTIKGLPNGPSPELDAIKERVKALSGKKPTTGQGNPPAAEPSSPALEYDMQPAGKGPTPPLENWLQNPSGERNILYKGPNDTIEGAKYGSDGNWHVQRDGKWMTIIPISGKKTKGPAMGGNERQM